MDEALVGAEIDRLLAGRRDRLVALRSKIAWWQDAAVLLRQVEAAAETVLADKSLDPELIEAVRAARVEDMPSRAGLAEQHLRDAERRLGRSTVNIGVSGQARVGKSTLLQALSGLGDQQIPTGSGLPVTAVRSRVYNSTINLAIVTFHSPATFLQEVVAPYFRELGLGSSPLTLEQFRAAEIGRMDPPGAEAFTESQLLLLDRLREMQVSLPNYESSLTGSTREMRLDELRPFVAYPKQEELQAGIPARLHLAVRDIRIECTFPRPELANLGLMDLPGLGELSAGAEDRHVTDIQQEVDVVLLLKRPLEGLAFWTKQDAAALELLERAAAPLDVRDFVLLVINSGPQDSPVLLDTLTGDIERRLNAVRSTPFRVLTANAPDRPSVDENVLVPALQHLIDRLPTMDERVASTSLQLADQERTALLLRLDSLIKALRVPVVGSMREQVDAAARELRKDLAEGLGALVDEFRSRARSGAEDADYVEAVEAAYRSIRDWIANGFGMGTEAWTSDALRTTRADRGAGPFATDQLNAIRVEISSRFAQIDGYFEARIDELLDEVRKELGDRLGGVLTPQTPDARESMRCFADYLRAAEEPAPTMAKAVDDLLGLRLDYRAQLHPRVRAEADVLVAEYDDPRTGERRSRVVADISEAGARQLLKRVSQLAEQAAHSTRQALLRESVLPALVLHAALEQFEDTLIRSGNSVVEFARVARSFRDDIWPARFSARESAVARVRAVAAAASAALTHLSHP